MKHISFTMDIEQGEECTEHAEGASDTCVSPLPAPKKSTVYPAEYDAVWSEWKLGLRQQSYAVAGDGTENMYLPE